MGDAVNLKYVFGMTSDLIYAAALNEAISFGMQRYDLTPVKEEPVPAE
jgi:hypothetical protein